MGLLWILLGVFGFGAIIVFFSILSDKRRNKVSRKAPQEGDHRIIENGLGKWRAEYFGQYFGKYGENSELMWRWLTEGTETQCRVAIDNNKESFAELFAKRERERLQKETKQTIYL